MPLNPLDQDEMATMEAEYREALQRQLAAHLEALECQEALEEVMGRAEEVLRRVRREASAGD